MTVVHPIPTGPKFKDLAGQQFGYLIVTGYAGKNGNGNCSWLCECVVCGKQKIKLTSAIRQSRSGQVGPACRCQKGLDVSTPEYHTWRGLKARCNNPKDKNYSNYGGRGIKVCEKWSKSFAAFLSDVGPRPSPNHSLDRFPDMNGNYEPGNVRWATAKEQSRNRRNNRQIISGGEKKLLVEWAIETGIRRDTIAARIKRGWSAEDALNKPIHKL